MCGIAGRLNFVTGAPVEAAVVARMCDLIAHRGPDGDGVYCDGPVGFGHRRLAIIDLSPGGAQPMRTADGALAITFNGEIYNYLELEGGARPAAGTSSARPATPRSSWRPTGSGATAASTASTGCSRSRCGTAASAAVRGPRSRRQEALLVPPRRRRDRLCVRAQGVSGRARRSRRGPTCRRISDYLSCSTCRRRGPGSRACSKLPPGPHADRRGRPGLAVQRYWKPRTADSVRSRMTRPSMASPPICATRCASA